MFRGWKSERDRDSACSSEANRSLSRQYQLYLRTHHGSTTERNGKSLITGGSRGIGRAIAEALADEGCNVAICARGEDGVNAAVEALSAKRVSAFGQAVDVGDGDALKAWVEASAETLGGIDNIVSNVTGGNGRSEQNWRSNFEHDMLGTVRLVEAGHATPRAVR